MRNALQIISIQRCQDALPCNTIRVLIATTGAAATRSTTATYTSGTGTLTVSALPSSLLVGTEVGYIAANGQYVGTGSWVSTFAAAGTTTVILNSAQVTVNSPTGTASTAMTIPASSTLVFTQYPEVYVKFNFGIHEYYNNTAPAVTL